MNPEAMPPAQSWSRGQVTSPWDRVGAEGVLLLPVLPHNATAGALLLFCSALFFPDRRLQYLTPQHPFNGLQIYSNLSVHPLAVPPFPAHPTATGPSVSQPAFLSPLPLHLFCFHLSVVFPGVSVSPCKADHPYSGPLGVAEKFATHPSNRF